ncbi:HelD family protein [Actinomadura oligospora]|uniref:HelD family protein n=1 Tax=Actinomadura oligospora TaxID=111804 RepID=UPI000683FA5A|nr:ATP-binding domain-containing protein [Actinomadura oligospora]
MYARLDAERDGAERSLREGPLAGGGGEMQAQLEKSVATDEAARTLSRLLGVEHGLCFGRVDHRPDVPGEQGDTFYIGRIGLRDEDREPLLIDWRAAAARPFYTATPSSPGSLARRRHLHTRRREVVRVDDEVFDLDGLGEDARRSVVGEAALLATLRRGRTGRMSDVVSTIQQEQDEVIRSGLHGVLVVQGGPGTGKTVAALHRAAYLLYTHRDVLERRGILVVGPNPTFLRYIEQVLPGLGETDVVLTTAGDLYPGVRATAHDVPDVAVVKGGHRMADLVEAAVQDRERVPEGGLSVPLDDLTLNVDAETCDQARQRATTLRAPHNVQRRVFVHEMLEALATDRAEQYERMIEEPLEALIADSGGVPKWLQELEEDAEETPLLDETDMRLAKAELWQLPPVRKALDELWPELTPQALLTELLADAEALVRLGAAVGLTADEASVLHREPGADWTVEDVPLLDEAAEWLGHDDPSARARQRAAAAERAEEERYAAEVIRMTEGWWTSLMDASDIAGRHHDDGPARTTADRAAADREWAYGHVIVDEAQELSEMAWRMVMRRVPTRSMTVVGDTAQTGSPAGARGWGEMLDRYVPGRWREQRLMVNYRTPAAIMKVAEDVLAAVDPSQTPPVPVRDDGPPPRAVRLDLSGSLTGLADLVAEEFAAVATGRDGEGRLAVISSLARHDEVRAALPEAPAGATPEALDAPVVVLTAEESKGLEFDAVIVVDPSGITTERPRGGHDLYVAVTRATRSLTVVHDDDLPESLSRLQH